MVHVICQPDDIWCYRTSSEWHNEICISHRMTYAKVISHPDELEQINFVIWMAYSNAIPTRYRISNVLNSLWPFGVFVYDIRGILHISKYSSLLSLIPTTIPTPTTTHPLSLDVYTFSYVNVYAYKHIKGMLFKLADFHILTQYIRCF